MKYIITFENLETCRANGKVKKPIHALGVYIVSTCLQVLAEHLTLSITNEGDLFETRVYGDLHPPSPSWAKFYDIGPVTKTTIHSPILPRNIIKNSLIVAHPLKLDYLKRGLQFKLAETETYHDL